MNTLMSILKVKSQTPTMILLEVKPGSQITLIENGFEGNEKLFRLQSQNRENFYTTFYGEELKAGGTYHWGYSSCTCASEDWTMQRNKILEVARQFGFQTAR